MDNKIKRKIEQLQRKGLMLGEIADELGVSENLVKEDLLTMGINPDISARVNFQNIEVDIDGVHKQKEEKEEDNKAQIEKIIQMPVSKSAITGIKERRSVIEDLYYNQGFSEKEISEAIDIAIKTVERDIEFLEKHRKVESVHLSKNEKEKSRARANKRKDEEKKCCIPQEEIILSSSSIESEGEVVVEVENIEKTD